MNERIKELAEQARVQDRGYFIYQYGGSNGHQSVEKVINLEMFAELIVRECVSVIKKNHPEFTCKEEADNLIRKAGRMDAIDEIRKQFGVEE